MIVENVRQKSIDMGLGKNIDGWVFFLISGPNNPLTFLGNYLLPGL